MRAEELASAGAITLGKAARRSLSEEAAIPRSTIGRVFEAWHAAGRLVIRGEGIDLGRLHTAEREVIIEGAHMSERGRASRRRRRP
jgi:hypothetical protein